MRNKVKFLYNGDTFKFHVEKASYPHLTNRFVIMIVPK